MSALTSYNPSLRPLLTSSEQSLPDYVKHELPLRCVRDMVFAHDNGVVFNEIVQVFGTQTTVFAAKPLNTSPSFQRNLIKSLAWKKCLLRDAILTNFNCVTPLFIHPRGDYFELLDGLQRLTTILAWISSKIVLTQADCVEGRFQGKFADFSDNLKELVLNQPIRFVVYSATLRDALIESVFVACQNNAKTSNGEQIHAMIGAKHYQQLLRLSDAVKWHIAQKRYLQLYLCLTCLYINKNPRVLKTPNMRLLQEFLDSDFEVEEARFIDDMNFVIRLLRDAQGFQTIGSNSTVNLLTKSNNALIIAFYKYVSTYHIKKIHLLHYTSSRILVFPDRLTGDHNAFSVYFDHIIDSVDEYIAEECDDDA